MDVVAVEGAVRVEAAHNHATLVTGCGPNSWHSTLWATTSAQFIINADFIVVVSCVPITNADAIVEGCTLRQARQSNGGSAVAGWAADAG